MYIYATNNLKYAMFLVDRPLHSLFHSLTLQLCCQPLACNHYCILSFCDSDYDRYLTEGELCSICPFAPGLRMWLEAKEACPLMFYSWKIQIQKVFIRIQTNFSLPYSPCDIDNFLSPLKVIRRWDSLFYLAQLI